jgi:hypothetical protein
MTASLAAATPAFLWTAVRAFGRPLNDGKERLWAGIWILLVLAGTVSLAVFGPRILRQLWGAGIAALRWR